MAPDIPWSVFALLVTGVIGASTTVIAWAIWRGNLTAKVETLSVAFQEHVSKDDKLQAAIYTELKLIGDHLQKVQERQAVIMHHLHISLPG